MRALLPVVSLCLLAACEQPPPPAETAAPAVTRPAFSLATDEAYDFDKIAPYIDSHDAVYDYVDANLDKHLAAIQRWLRQPSISAQNVGIREMAELVRQDLEDLGFAEAERTGRARRSPPRSSTMRSARSSWRAARPTRRGRKGHS